MKDSNTVTIQVTEEEKRLIMACLAMAGAMCSMGRSHEGLEQYRKTMNLKDKISETLTDSAIQ